MICCCSRNQFELSYHSWPTEKRQNLINRAIAPHISCGLQLLVNKICITFRPKENFKPMDLNSKQSYFNNNNWTWRASCRPRWWPWWTLGRRWPRGSPRPHFLRGRCPPWPRTRRRRRRARGPPSAAASGRRGSRQRRRWWGWLWQDQRLFVTVTHQVDPKAFLSSNEIGVYCLHSCTSYSDYKIRFDIKNTSVFADMSLRHTRELLKELWRIHT